MGTALTAMLTKKPELTGFERGLATLNSTEQIPFFLMIYGRLPETAVDFAVIRHNELGNLLSQHTHFLKHPEQHNYNPLNDIHYHPADLN